MVEQINFGICDPSPVWHNIFGCICLMGNAELGSIRINITSKSNGTKNEKQHIYIRDRYRTTWTTWKTVDRLLKFNIRHFSKIIMLTFYMHEKQSTPIQSFHYYNIGEGLFFKCFLSGRPYYILLMCGLTIVEFSQN